MTTLAAHSPGEDRFLTAIAVRNRAWVRYRIAVEAWLRAGSPTGEALALVNDRQNEYEHAARDVIRARVFFRQEAPLTRAA